MSRNARRRAAAALAVVVAAWCSVLPVVAVAQPAPSPPPPSPVLVAPRLLEPARVALPQGAAPLEGDAAVDVLLTIDATGAVTQSELVAPVRPDVDEAVLAAAPSLRFAPATRDGAPIPARIRFRFVVPATPSQTQAPPSIGEANTSPSAPPSSQPSETIQEPETPPEEPTASFGSRAVVVPPDPGAASRIVLTGEELTTVPGTFGEPLRVVATLPGVARTPFGIGYFLVRGASFENTGFFVDGFPVPILYHLGAGPAVLSSRLVERLDFYPGGYPVSFGRFNAGVISLRTAPPKVDRFRLELEMDLFRASAFVAIPLPNDRGIVAAAVRRSYYELILPLLVDGISLSFADYQLRAEVKISERVRAHLFVFGSDNQLDTRRAVGTGETATESSTGVGYSFVRVTGKLELRLPHHVRVAWSGMTGLDRTVARSRSPGQSDLALEGLATWAMERLEATWEPNERFRSLAGLDLQATMLGANASLPTPAGFGMYPQPRFTPQTFAIDANIVLYGIAGYLEQKLTLGPLELTPGLRLDHLRYAEVSTAVLDPRIVARLRVHERLVLKAATGRFVQNPQVFQLIGQIGDPTLAPNRSWQSSAGLELTLPYSLEIETQGFYTQMWHLARPSMDLAFQTDGTVRRQFYFDDGEGRAYGLELLVRRKAEQGLYGWLSYTLSRSERFIADGSPVPFNFDQTHVLNVAASYKVGRWRFGVRFQLATGRPTRAVTGASYDADGDRYSPQRTGLTARLPVYHQLDARIDYETRLGPFDASIYLDAINVYNAHNAEGYVYQYDFARRDRLPGLPLLATLGLKLVY